MLAALLLMACHHAMPPVEGLPEPASSLRDATTEIADRQFNRGRYRAILEIADDRGLAAETEWIDWFSVQRNVLIELPGETDRIVYVVAHYDKLDINLLAVISRLVNGLIDPLIAWSYLGQGALDNASGVAVALEVAAWAASAPRRFTYRILLVGSEEQGLRGTRAHVARLTAAEKERIELAINVDSVGLRDREVCLLDTGGDAGWYASALASAGRAGIPLSTERLPPIATSDHAPFQRHNFGWDFGRGLLFSGPGGLLPQRSWFTGPLHKPTLFYASCDVWDAGDIVASLIAVPTGQLHGPRDRLEVLDPALLWRTWALIEALLTDIEAADGRPPR